MYGMASGGWVGIIFFDIKSFTCPVWLYGMFYFSMMIRYIILLLPLMTILLAGCGTNRTTFVAADQPPKPDYTNPDHWSALPFREDAADVVPYGETWVSDSAKAVDVFYIYPTLYRSNGTWCADVNNEKLNKRLDKLPVRLQASVFNKVGRVYAPRYRQAHIDAFTDTTGEGVKALNFAYEDVKAAFEYYMEHHNNGRPIIIASHSQGTWHARKLLKEYFDDSEAKGQLVCAYIVGYAIYPEEYESLTLCQTPEETRCYVTWSSFREGYMYPDTSKDLLVGDTLVNPISWTTDNTPATEDAAILLKPQKKKTYTTTAWIHDDMLWVDTRLLLMKRRKNLHVVDYNLFWYSIRQNAEYRVSTYWQK